MKHTLLFISALLLMPLAALRAADADARKPNVIVFLVDDMGWTSWTGSRMSMET